MSDPAKTIDQNILPVQALFNLDNSFNTFIGQGQPFYATTNPDQSGLNITNSTIDNTTIGAITPSTGVFTNILTNTGQITTTPTASLDIANKAYVDATSQGLSFKQPVLVTTTGNITLSGTQTIDNIAVSVGDRVLVKNQTTQSQNGIYIVSAGAWSRSLDANTWDELLAAYLFVLEGTVWAGSSWVDTNVPGGTLGTTPVTFVQFSNNATYTAGTGLTLTGFQFSITPVGTAGTYGSASNVPVLTTNASGQVSSVTNTPIAIGASQVTSGTFASSLLSGSYTGITGVGTLTAGTWNGSTIGVAYGGTGANTFTAGYLKASGTSAFSTVSTIPSSDITGLGTMASQNANAVNITGGTISGLSSPLAVASGGTGAVSLTGYVKGTGTAALTASTTIPTTDLSGTITNAQLANSSITINGNAVSLGGSTTVTANTTNTLTIGTGLSGGSFNGSAAVTIANTGVLSFSAGTTGFTPNTATTGVVTLGGLLSLGSGGTNANLTAVAGGVVYSGASALAISAAGTTGQFLQSNGTGAPTWATPVSYATVTDDTTTAGTRYPLFANQTSGNLSTEYTSSTKLQYNPSTGIFTATGFSGSGASLTSLTAGNLSGTIPSGVLGNSSLYIGTTAVPLNAASGSITSLAVNISGSAGSATTATTATNANNVAVTDNTSSSATWYPTLVSTTTGNLPITTSSTKLSFVPSTGLLSSTIINASSLYQGDFSNATVNSRTLFKTSTTNSSTGIYAVPNGTSTAASWQASNAADPTNASKILIATNGSTDVQLVSGINGTGTYLPMSFWNNGAEKARLSVSGGFSVGTTTDAGSTNILAAGTVTGTTIIATNSVNTPNTFGFKNRIINGAMGIWQRGTSFGSTFGIYTADRWWVGNQTSAAQSSDTPSSAYSYSLEVANTGASFPLTAQRIESANCQDLVSQQVTVSIWIKNVSGSAAVSAELYYATAKDNFASTTLIQSVQLSASPSSSWTLYTTTFNALPSSAANGIELRFFRTNASASTTRYTGVQLEKGSTATSFDYRPYGTELFLCQRYFYNATPNNPYGFLTMGATLGTTNGSWQIPLPVPMRVTPTFAYSGAIVIKNLSSVAVTAFAGPYGTASPCNSVEGDFTCNVTLGGQAAFINFNNSGKLATFSAEL